MAEELKKGEQLELPFGHDDKDVQIEKAIAELTPKEKLKHDEALAEGHKDEECPKCGVVFLAHHHLIRCHHARHGDCPMVKLGTKSLLEGLLGSNDEEIP